MAKISHMIAEKVISGMKGVVDYYYYMGVSCARKWPRSPGHKRAPQVEAGWPIFTEAVHLWSKLSEDMREPYRVMSSGSGLSDRDLFMRAYMSGYKRLIATVDELE